MQNVDRTSAVQNAINQLDGYLTWRDCKTALIFFVKNKDFIKVLETVKQKLLIIPKIRQTKEIDKNEFECCFISDSNAGQIVTLRVMLFNLYSERSYFIKIK
jgi:hypothetical protein